MLSHHFSFERVVIDDCRFEAFIPEDGSSTLRVKSFRDSPGGRNENHRKTKSRNTPLVTESHASLDRQVRVRRCHPIGLRYTGHMPGKVGRPVERSLRKRISELLKSGASQAEIARILDKAPSTIAHHVRALGRKPKEYETPAPVGKDGKRRCAQCGKRKFPGSFPGDRNASCSVCIRGLTD